MVPACKIGGGQSVNERTRNGLGKASDVSVSSNDVGLSGRQLGQCLKLRFDPRTQLVVTAVHFSQNVRVLLEECGERPRAAKPIMMKVNGFHRAVDGVIWRPGAEQHRFRSDRCVPDALSEACEAASTCETQSSNAAPPEEAD